MSPLIKSFSLNVRGLRSNQKKRQKTFKQFRNKYKSGFVFLQETHSSQETENLWSKEWGGEILFSHGSTNARGVAVLCPTDIEYKIESVTRDSQGRYLIIKVTIEDETHLLVNVYAPSDNEKDKIAFITDLKSQIANHEVCNLVLGGDFNIHLHPTLDYKGNRTEQDSEKYRAEILAMLDTFELTDVWRLYNGNTFKFTWHSKTKKIFSRLDYWFISDHLLNRVDTVDIHPAMNTDHDIISLSLKPPNDEKRGPSYFKLNNSPGIKSLSLPDTALPAALVFIISLYLYMTVSHMIH